MFSGSELLAVLALAEDLEAECVVRPLNEVTRPTHYLYTRSRYAITLAGGAGRRADEGERS